MNEILDRYKCKFTYKDYSKSLHDLKILVNTDNSITVYPRCKSFTSGYRFAKNLEIGERLISGLCEYKFRRKLLKIGVDKCKIKQCNRFRRTLDTLQEIIACVSVLNEDFTDVEDKIGLFKALEENKYNCVGKLMYDLDKAFPLVVYENEVMDDLEMHYLSWTWGYKGLDSSNIITDGIYVRLEGITIYEL
ncbi:hypothetical protein UT300012_21500 [Paraclostridium bifermentans]